MKSKRKTISSGQGAGRRKAEGRGKGGNLKALDAPRLDIPLEFLRWFVFKKHLQRESGHLEATANARPPGTQCLA